MTRRKKVSFKATKRVPREVHVSFRTRRGKRISFDATKRVSRKVKVEFYVKRKRH